MFAAASSPSSRRAIAPRNNALVVALLLTSACATKPSPQPVVAPDEITHFRVPVKASLDSTLKLARLAIGVVNGSHLEKPERDKVLISTRYERERDKGITQVTIFASVIKKPSPADSGATIVELQAWAVDLIDEVRTKTLSGRNIPRLQSNAPIGESAQHVPYLVTPSKMPLDWPRLEEVLAALVALTRKPSPTGFIQRTTATEYSVAVAF